jgi:tetratricopeptide (TPR) repeat protein
MVRDMADQGYADNLGLASSSFLWEAKADVKLGRYIEAIERYLDLYDSGDGFVPEVLPSVIKHVFDSGPSTLQEAAGNPNVRRVISIYVSSHGGSWYYDLCIPNEQVVAWLDAVEAIDARDMETADLLAWAAYRSGRTDLARRWLARCPETGLALWLQAKLSMRGGRLQEAAAFLEAASEKLSSDVILGGYLYYSGETYYESFPHNTDLTGWFTFPSRRALAELGVLQLAIGNYAKALDSSFKAGYWLDAAYIAERVLTPDELKAYVDENWPDPGPGIEPSESRYYEDMDHFMARGPRQQAFVIRYLLARRLTRIGRCQEARDYYPEKWRPVLDAYVMWIGRGNDTSLGDQDRADALWQAARIARYQGIDLMGTELEPDWAVAWGSWGGDGTSSCRADRHFMGPFHSSPSERERIRRSELETQPQKRFHYRYKALDLAWAAVELMPDESDETARRLCEAGGWLKNRDPEAADRFYKAMVIRCGTTALGQEADQRHWFPDCEQ